MTARGLWSGRLRYLLDACVLLWTAFWVALGVVISRELAGLAAIATPINDVGATMNESARALAGLGSLPFVGQDMSAIAASAHRAAADAYTTSSGLRGTIAGASSLLGLFLAGVPVLVVLAVYLPGRIARGREVAFVRGALRREDPVIDEFLAQRALQRLSLRRLRRLSPSPWHDVAVGSYRDLADAELMRLGVRRPA